MLEQYQRTSAPINDWEDMNDGSKQYESLRIERTSEHTRAFLKIQDGCNQFCSYCIIPYARGRVRSRKPQEVLQEVRRLAENGCKEVVLTGIHLSSYGTDFSDISESFAGEALLQLIRQIHEIPGISRIRLGSLEPGIISEPFVKELAGMEKLCPHFHLSLQSGCDTVLRRMNRKYSTREYADRCGILRSFFDHPAITTDVIVGFPGETQEEFQETERFLEQLALYEMHIFKYSIRQGTKAAAMEGQIAETVKARRSARLLALGEKMSVQYRESLVGEIKSVLLEEALFHDNKRYEVGYTTEYVKIAVESQQDRANRLVRGRIAGHLTQDIYLMVEF